jgi:hypothetical protein
MMKVLTYPFMALAAIGFVLSVVVHVMSLLNMTVPFGSSAFALHFGIFIVWLPTVIVSQQATKGIKRADFWKEGLKGCPHWMRIIAIGCGYYALINFAIFIFLAPPKGQSVSPPPPIVLRGFSGHWMAFYAVAFAVLYSWMRTRDANAKKDYETAQRH